MFAEERYDNIISSLNKNGTVKVKDLSSELGVTEDCIRKDLTYLEKEGLLKRTHGGAVLPRNNIHQFTVISRKNVNIKAKRIIATKAMELIKSGYTIFLDVSTTNIQLANLLFDCNKEVIVVTNMLEIVSILAKSKNITVISVGGMLNNPGDAFVGSLSNEIIEKFKFDLCFLGIVGLDVYKDSTYSYHVEDGVTKAVAAKASKKVYIEAEESKFLRDGNYKFIKLSDITGVIVDKLPPEKIMKQLRKLEVEIL